MQTALQELASAAPVTGNVQLIFNPVHEGKVWTGSIIIASNSGLTLTSLTIAPIQWEAKDTGNTIAKWFNDLPSPTMQAKGQVIVTGSNIANTETLQARFYGVATNLNETPIVWPSPPPAPPPNVPKVIVSNNVSLPAGTTLIGSIQPVLIGTSVEIFECITAPQGGGNTARLAIQWSIDGLFTDPIEWDFDLPISGTMRGLILPNLAPFIRFLGLTGAGQEQISLTALTGLPPIVRSPIIPSGDLTRYNTSIADGADSGQIFLPSYVGDAQVFLTATIAGAVVPAGALFAILRSADYLGVSSELGRIGAINQMTAGAGTTSMQPAFIWKMGPRINSIQIYNRIGTAAAIGVDMAISVTNP